MTEHLPLSLQTTYRDLLDRHLRPPTPEIEGSIAIVENKGGRYWVARRRIGSRIVETRIGPDSDEIRAKSEALRLQNETLRAWARDAARLVAQLRAARMPTPTPGTGKLVNALARAGLFRSGCVLAGTHAYGLYALELGMLPKDELAKTEDVDVAAPRAVSMITGGGESLTTSLEGVGLRPIAGPDDPHPVRWETEDGIVLDVLTPRRRGGTPTVRHRGLGLRAQAVAFLEFSLVDPIDAVVLYREGIPVRIPSPERFAVHKLIVASARTGTHRAKSEKDLAQAAWLITALAEARPFELAEALGDARGRGAKWRAAIDASLARRPDIGEALGAL
jgi:hypothetical protein